MPALQQAMASQLYQHWQQDEGLKLSRTLADAEEQVWRHHQVLSTVMVDAEWRDHSIGAIIEDIIRRYLNLEGIVVGDILGGPTLEHFQVRHQDVLSVFGGLAFVSGMQWC